MASTIKGITIEIGGDVTKLDKAMSTANSKTRSLQSELKQVEKLLKLDPTNTELLAQKQKLLKDAVGETSGKLDVLKEAQAQVQAQFEKGEVSEEQYRALQREIVKTETDLKNLKTSAEESNSKLESAGEAIGKIGEKSQAAGQALLPVTAGVAAIGAASVVAFNEVDSGYDTIITKTGATGDTLEGLQTSMDNVFSNIPTDAETAGTAIGEVNKRFELTGGKLEDLSTQFIQFSEINGTDLTTSIDTTDAIMTKFGVDASETGNVLGLMTKAGQETGISMDTLQSTLETNGSTLKEMGLDITGSVNLLSQFESSGVDASTAMAGLKKAQQNATAEGKTLEEALGGTIDSIKNAGSETEALQIATELFGKKGATEMTQAIREGRFSVDDLNGSLSEYGTVVGDTFNSTLDAPDQAAVTLNNLKLAGADLANTGMQALAPMLESIVAKVKSFATWFKTLNTSQQQTIIKIALLVAAIAPALIIFGKVASGISSIISVVTQIGPIITAAKAAFAAFNAVLAANPIILIVLAVIALIAIFVLLYTKCEWFRNGVNAIWEAIKVAFFVAFDAIKNFFMVTLPGAFNTIVDFIKNNWQALLLLLVNPFAGAFLLLYNNCEGFRNTVNSLVEGIKSFFQGLKDKIVALFTGIGAWFGQKFTAAYTGIKNAFTGIGTWFLTKYNEVTAVFTGIGGWFLKKFGEAYKGVTDAFAGVKGFFSGIWTDISGVFTSIGTKVGDAIGGAFKGVINGVLNTVESTINTAIDFINDAIDVINKAPGVKLGHVDPVNLPQLATGGIVKNGQAIFAEAGPELLTMVNGNAVVTPLTNSARTAALNQAGATSGSSGAGFTQNNYYTSPKALSPSESARLTRNATRNMIISLQRG